MTDGEDIDEAELAEKQVAELARGKEPDTAAEKQDAELARGKEPDTAAEKMMSELARREEISNDQREKLFRHILMATVVSLIVVTSVVVIVGLGWLQIETPVLVAFISAIAAQSFILIGLLARGLFISPSKPRTSSGAE